MSEPKEPWLAVLASFIWPGVGHVYAGRKALGVGIALLYPVILLAAMYGIAAPSGSSAMGVVLTVPILCGPFAAGIHAFFIARAGNSAEFEAERRAKKDPWLAAFLSVVFPIFGFVYLRLWAATVLVVAVLAVCAAADTYLSLYLPPISLPLMPACYVVLALSAYRYAVRLRASAVQHPARMIALCLCTSYVLLVSIQILNWKVVRTYSISGRSMAPTLQPGDKITVRRSVDPVPERGALFVYVSPVDPSSDWICRVVGLPGERVEIRDDKRMYVNDVALDASPIESQPTYDPDGVGSEAKTFWIVPQGHVFVLGDNPTLARDSRGHGPVDLRKARGIAYKIWWPLDRAGPVR